MRICPGAGRSQNNNGIRCFGREEESVAEWLWLCRDIDVKTCDVIFMRRFKVLVIEGE